MPSGFTLSGLTPGAIYTALGSVWVEPGVTVAFTAGGVQGEPLTPLEEWQDSRVHFTAVGSTALITLTLVSGSGHALLDEVAVVEGVYVGPYFDGSMSEGVVINSQRVTPEWDGAEHESTSTINIYQDLPTTARDGDTWLIEGQLWYYLQDHWRSLGGFSI